MAPRFYVDSDFQSGCTIVLPEKPAHHASRVLRMREGDAAVLFDGKGLEAQAVMHFFADRTEAEIIAVQKSQTESPLQTEHPLIMLMSMIFKTVCLRKNQPLLPLLLAQREAFLKKKSRLPMKSTIKVLCLDQEF